MRDKEIIKTEVIQVKELGEKIGYGHLMELASALWRKSLQEKGYPTSGAFIPIIEALIVKDALDISKRSKTTYDEFVRW